jgi:LmbE family N-acetylglucosaminyl deacetylase
MSRAGDTPLTLLLLAAHPHDEFALAATLRAHARAGDVVWCAWFAHDDRPKIEEQRRAEALQAMERIGVPTEHAIFADLPALALALQLPTLVDAVHDVVERVGPDVVFCPAYEGGHPDHDALNFAAWEAAGSRGHECREYPMYRRTTRPRRLFRRVPRFARLLPGMSEPDTRWLDRREVAFKRSLWRVYKSQRPVFDVLLRFSGDEQRFFTTEQTRVLPLRDYMKPPHERPLLYEQQAEPGFSFEEFARMVRRYQWAGGIEDGEL